METNHKILTNFWRLCLVGIVRKLLISTSPNMCVCRCAIAVEAVVSERSQLSGDAAAAPDRVPGRRR